jgi:2,5-diketo-D-gluconate reductase A
MAAIKLPLNDGYDIPSIGIASFRRDTNKAIHDLLYGNFSKGIRHYEISELYGNGNVIVDSLKACGAQRDDLYITLKVIR